MKRNYITIFVFIALSLFYANDVLAANICPDGSIKTGKEYYVIRGSHPIRSAPGAKSKKLINDKVSASVSEPFIYRNIDESCIVFEECTYNGWSYVYIVNPDWLTATHRGWVKSEWLAKSENGDKYLGKIPSYTLSPYTEKDYPVAYRRYKPRLQEIEKMRREAAEMAVDTGLCGQVSDVQVSDSRSTLNNITIWVDCDNRGVNKRFIYTEKDIAERQK